jgi:hypothetical protein
MFASMPPIQKKMSSDEKRLLACFQALAAKDQHALLAFAQFLGAQASSDEEENQDIQQPLGLPREEGESVVKAIKRLTANYPMVNPDNLLNETSRLMSEHLMQGRNAVEIIDELETIFLNEYQKLIDSSDATT